MSHNVRRFSLFLFTAVVVLALSLGAAISPAAAIVVTPLDQCGIDGGIWDGADSSNGVCYYDSSPIPELCPGYTYVAIEFVAGSEVAIGCSNTVGDTSNMALVPSLGAFCIIFGGIWEGDYAGENGTCTFPDGSEGAFINCGPGYDAVFSVVGGSEGDGACIPAGTGGGGTAGTGGGGTIIRVPGFGRFGMAVNGVSEGGLVSLSGGKNGSVTYDPGTCLGKCTLGPNLPGGAHADLPDDAVAWLYFKSVDENGDPGTGTYTVCFNVGDLTSPVIYRYVSGAWVVVSSTISGRQVCTSASGDGAFALGGS